MMIHNEGDRYFRCTGCGTLHHVAATVEEGYEPVCIPVVGECEGDMVEVDVDEALDELAATED